MTKLKENFKNMTFQIGNMPNVKANVPEQQLVKNLSDPAAGYLLLQGRYDTYTRDTVRSGVDVEFKDIDELSRFMGIDIRGAVLGYYSDASKYKYDLDAVLFLEIAEGIASLCRNIESKIDQKHQHSYNVDIAAIKQDIFYVENGIRSARAMDLRKFQKINSMLKELNGLSIMLRKETSVHDKLKNNPIAFLDESIGSYRYLMAYPDVPELIYDAIKSKYSLYNAPNSFNNVSGKSHTLFRGFPLGVG